MVNMWTFITADSVDPQITSLKRQNDWYSSSSLPPSSAPLIQFQITVKLCHPYQRTHQWSNIIDPHHHRTWGLSQTEQDKTDHHTCWIFLSSKKDSERNYDRRKMAKIKWAKFSLSICPLYNALHSLPFYRAVYLVLIVGYYFIHYVGQYKWWSATVHCVGQNKAWCTVAWDKCTC